MLRIPSRLYSSNDLSFIQSENKPYGQQNSIWFDLCLFPWPSRLVFSLSLILPQTLWSSQRFWNMHSCFLSQGLLFKFLPRCHFPSKELVDCVIKSSSQCVLVIPTLSCFVFLYNTSILLWTYLNLFLSYKLLHTLWHILATKSSYKKILHYNFTIIL